MLILAPISSRCGDCTEKKSRNGITLLEVVVSLAIFLFAVAILVQATTLGSENAMTAHYTSQGQLLCQSVMAKLAVGAESLVSTDYNAFPDDGNADWEWKVQADLGMIEGLSEVHVSVRTKKADGTYFEITMSRLILDPVYRGSTEDKPAEPPPEPETEAPDASEAEPEDEAGNEEG